jgi:hypothetical protein
MKKSEIELLKKYKDGMYLDHGDDYDMIQELRFNGLLRVGVYT